MTRKFSFSSLAILALALFLHGPAHAAPASLIVISGPTCDSLPDLVVSSVTDVPGYVRRIVVRVMNVGGTRSATSVTRIVFYTGCASGNVVVNLLTQELGRGQYVDLPVNVPPHCRADEYRCITVDAMQQIKECNEHNTSCKSRVG